MKKQTPANRRETGGLIEAGKATRFQPGQSGNPSGRPSTKPLTDELKRRLRIRLAATTAKRLGLRTSATVAEGVAASLIAAALAGNVAAFKEIADRLQGRAVQSVQFDGEIRTTTDLGSDALVIEKLLGASNASDGSPLYAQLVAFMRTSRDEKSIEAATALALELKKGGIEVPT